jgi:cell division protein FtsW
MTQVMTTMTVSQDQPTRKKAHGLPFDGVLLVIVGGLLAVGLMMVYSATFDWSYLQYHDQNTIFLLQLRSLVIGLVAMFIAARLDYHWWRYLALAAMGGALVMLIWVLLRGAVTFGAQRSLFNGSVQPSELAKFATVAYLAVWLSSKGDKIRQIGYGIVPFGLIIGVVTALILLQPDLSAAATVVIVAVIMFFVAGADLLQMGMVGVIGSAAAWAVVQVSTTGRKRLLDYVSGLQNIMQASWQVKQAAIAFVNGGVFGQGLGESYQKFGFLPTPHTDSIFAVIGEELGLVGCLVVIVLFIALAWRGFKIAAEARDSLGAILAAGMVSWVGLEALINIAVMVGAMPVAGNALPFISYGGSNLVMTLLAMGVLLSVSRRRDTESMPRKTRSAGLLGDYAPDGEPAGEGMRNAAFDFSRRNRRGRLSRPGRRQ